MDKQLVIFDMDGTMLESMKFWRILTRDYVKQIGLEWTEQLDKDVESFSIRETADYLVDNQLADHSSEEIMKLCFERMAHYYEHEVYVKDGVLPYLDHLRDKGVRMSVATATHRDLALPVLERLDMMQYFDELVCVSDIGVSKKKPDIYLKCAEFWDQEPEDVAVFEDAPYALRTAAAAGFYTVLMYDDVFALEQREVLDLADVAVAKMDQLLDLEELAKGQEDLDTIGPWALLAEEAS